MKKLLSIMILMGLLCIGSATYALSPTVVYAKQMNHISLTTDLNGGYNVRYNYQFWYKSGMAFEGEYSQYTREYTSITDPDFVIENNVTEYMFAVSYEYNAINFKNLIFINGSAGGFFKHIKETPPENAYSPDKLTGSIYGFCGDLKLALTFGSPINKMHAVSLVARQNAQLPLKKLNEKDDTVRYTTYVGLEYHF